MAPFSPLAQGPIPTGLTVAVALEETLEEWFRFKILHYISVIRRELLRKRPNRPLEAIGQTRETYNDGCNANKPVTSA